MAATSIEWTDLSFNPIRARRLDGWQRVPGHFCQKISPGCANCYASNFQKRFHMPSFPGVKTAAADAGVEVFLDEELLVSLLSRRKAARVFWCDMSDLFGDWVPFEWIDKCFAVMALTPYLTHQVLTKRPGRMREYLSRSRGMVSYWMGRFVKWDEKSIVESGEIQASYAKGNPLPNVWLGTSVENQEHADKRIIELLQCPAAVRFLSAEPLLGPIELPRAVTCRTCGNWYVAKNGQASAVLRCPCRPISESNGIHWVIVGGESGPHSRPCNVEWIRSIVRQCQSAGVACFVKQVGSRPWVDMAGTDDGFPEGTVAIPDQLIEGDTKLMGRVQLKNSKGGDMEEFPADLRVRQFPKVSATDEHG